MGLDWIDQAKAVRSGEELDVARLEAYLKEQLPSTGGPIVIEQFPSGYSNLTYLLRAGDQQLVLRRPPFGAQIKSGHDMSREYRILSHLQPVYPKAPRPLIYCDDESVIGAPFYIMERVQGMILRANKPKGLALTPETMQQLSNEFVETLAELHALDYAAAGLGDLGKPAGYVKRQVEGWIGRYEKSQTDNIAAMEQVGGWMTQHMPPEAGAALIHNDFKYDNLVLDPQDFPRIIAVLDWEMATLGDPLMDLGTSLAYWVDPDDPAEMNTLAFGLTTLPGNLTRQQIVDRYAETRRCDVSNALFYYVFGLYKVAVIVQQIYYRYKQGHTQDPRFAVLIMAVQVLSKTASLALDKNRIDRLTA